MNDSIILSKHVELPLDPAHGIHNGYTLVVSPDSQQFKETFVLPNLLQGNGSFVVCDLGGTLLTSSRTTLESKGYEIRVIEVGSTGLLSEDDPARTYYNPLYFLSTPNDAMHLAASVMDHTRHLAHSVKAPILNTMEKRLLQSCFLYLTSLPSEADKSLTAVQQLFTIPEGEHFPKLDNVMQRLAEENPEHPAPSIYASVKNKCPSSLLSSLCSTCWLRLHPFSFAILHDFPSKNTIELADLSKKKVALFLVPNVINNFTNFLFTNLVSQAIAVLKAHAIEVLPKSPAFHVQFFVDTAFGNAFSITSNTDSPLNFGLSFVFHAASFASMEENLGEDARAFIRSCHARLYYDLISAKGSAGLFSLHFPTVSFRDLRHLEAPLGLANFLTLRANISAPKITRSNAMVSASFGKCILVLPKIGSFLDEAYSHNEAKQ